jgi:D-amino-acid dehydrogenase
MSNFIVLGAGMVGVSTALALQEQGHRVLIVDRSEPGSGASFGNAGIIQVEATEPYPFPRDARTLIRMAFKRDNALNYHLSALPASARALFGYFLNSAPGRYPDIVEAYRTIIEPSGIDHDYLVASAGAEDLVHRTGYMQMHRTSAEFDQDAANTERVARQHGVKATILDNSALRREEPALRRDFAGAIHWLESRTCIDPGALVNAYADLFQRRGGSITKGDALSLTAGGAGWRVTLNDGSVAEAEQVVIALGSSSPTLLHRLGFTFPMVRKRGYHRHYSAKYYPTRPLFDVAAAVLYCPQTRGLRLTTGAEIARFPNGPKTPRQLDRAEQYAREIFELGSAVESEPWTGWRPCMPDMLPVIGPLPATRGVWCNFGHGHQGFTLGPTTAKMLAAEIAGSPWKLASRFSPARYC